MIADKPRGGIPENCYNTLSPPQSFCSRRNFPRQSEIVPQDLPLPFADTVTILGILLDNAVRSCADCGKETEIILSVVYQQNTLLFHMENPCRERELKPYGTGLRNVARAARKYSGTVRTHLENGIYTTDIVLYNL